VTINKSKMARFKELIGLVFGTIALLLLAYTVSKDVDEIEAWNSRGLLRGEPSGQRTESTSRGLWNPSGSETEYYLTDQEEYSTPSVQQDVVEKVSSIKVSVTVPSISNRNKHKLSNITYNQDNLLEIYKERKSLISKTCRRYKLGRFGEETKLKHEPNVYQEMENLQSIPVQNSLMWEQKWHMLYCWIHKVASSTWSQLFFNLHGKQVPATRLHEAAQYFHPISSQVSSAVSNSLVFTFVRHPFERLVSAYRDKFELANKYSYVYSLYVGKILGLNKKLKSNLMIENAKSLNVVRSRRPSFSEFVDYLLREEVHNYNDHWRPYWLHCHLCEMEFDVIGKMETWNQDVQFITDVTGLSMTNVTLEWTNRRSNKSSSTLAQDYFRKLDKQTTIKLYNIYKIDFEMFGYSLHPYLNTHTQP